MRANACSYEFTRGPADYSRVVCDGNSIMPTSIHPQTTRRARGVRCRRSKAASSYPTLARCPSTAQVPTGCQGQGVLISGANGLKQTCWQVVERMYMAVPERSPARTSARAPLGRPVAGRAFGYSSCLKWGYAGTIDVAAFDVAQAADVLGLDLTKVAGRTELDRGRAGAVAGRSALPT